jgi:hypothetical protein
MKQKFLLRIFSGRWIAFGLAAALCAGCGIWSSGVEVKPGVAVNEVYLSVPENLTKSPWMETFLWTIKCEATEGEICEGSPRLLIPPDKTLCHYDYKIVPGSEGNTDPVILKGNDSSIQVYIRAVGGPDWNPYKSKIIVRVRAVGVAREADLETRKALSCDPLSPSNL